MTRRAFEAVDLNQLPLSENQHSNHSTSSGGRFIPTFVNILLCWIYLNVFLFSCWAALLNILPQSKFQRTRKYQYFEQDASRNANSKYFQKCKFKIFQEMQIQNISRNANLKYTNCISGNATSQYPIFVNFLEPMNDEIFTKVTTSKREQDS